jgi:radical SAM superfamily enzyme YgiQ (UPF0313 family)
MFCLIRLPAVECVRFATTSPNLPLGLAYIAAALEQAGERVCVLDAVAEAPTTYTRYMTGYLIGLPLEELAARVPDSATRVGISVIFTHEWPAAVRLVQLLRRARPALQIVLGGEHVTSMPEFCLATSEADCLVLGEGEETVVELVRALAEGRALDTVDGLAFRDAQRLVVNRRRARRADVDAIAWPAWHHFALRTYHDNRFIGAIYTSELAVPILATRGCPYQCTYCSSPNMWTPRWIPRDPIKVVDEIEHYVNTYGARNFPFQDLTAIVKKDWIVRFCNELLRRDLKITWQLPSGTRSEAIDAEVARLLKRTGMSNMAYAPESGSERTRKLIKKKMTTERLFESIRAAAEAELNVSFFIVLGLPHDTTQDFAETERFLERAARAGVRDCSVAYYMALPGTELFDSLCDSGQIRFDREYFAHMLHNLALVPVRSFNTRFDRLALARWKLRLLFAFYRSASREADAAALLTNVRRGLGGLLDGSHDSKLPTAVRNALFSAVHSASARLGRSWLPSSEERALFSDWDRIFRQLRAQQLACGARAAAPADTEELHRHNVAEGLKRNHETPRRLAVV